MTQTHFGRYLAEIIYLSVPITKATETDNGAVYVEGVATNDALDLDDQIIDKTFARDGLTKWFTDYANVRQMHSGSLAPAGKAVEFEERPEGFWVRTKVVEPTAVKLVREGVYQAYSVGIIRPRIIRDGVAKNGRVVDGVFHEISLVDFPANPTSKFEIAKRLGARDGAPIEVVDKHVRPELTKAVEAPVSVKPSDVAELLRKLGKIPVGKREFDRDVGGGVDRDTVPAEDFAGPERSFPIVTPGDVPDAVSSLGRTKHDRAAIKRNIIRIAARKGAAFVDALPESWKDTHTTNTDQADVGKTAEAVVKAVKDCAHCGKSHHADSPAKFCADCGHKLPAMAKRKDAEHGLADHPEPDGDEVGPDDDGDGDGNQKDLDRNRDGTDDRVQHNTAKAAPYHLVRLHDATCAAFRDGDVLAVHPALAKGIPSTIDASTWAAEVTKALTEDAGTGARMHDIPVLSQAYGLAVQLQKADAELLEQGMTQLRKAFSELYPDAHPTPVDIQPGRFQRPYIAGGHAPFSAAAGQKPRIPLASHVPDPSDFQRPLLTDGHQAAPADTVGKGRTFYTNTAKDQARANLTAMHDYIAEQHPDVCPMHATAADGEPAMPGSMGSTLTTATAAASAVDNQATSTPVPVSAGQTEAVVTKAAVEATVDPGLLAQVARDALRDQLDTLTESLDTLEKRLSDLEAGPDPAQAAFRGSAALAAFRPPAEDTPAGRGDTEEAEKLVRLVKRARHPASEVSRPAIEALMTKVGAAQTADLLG